MILCVIKVIDGVPHQHPILWENFQQAFPGVDASNLPDGYEWFERHEFPGYPLGQVLAQPMPTYEFINGVWQDVWHFRGPTEEEARAEADAIFEHHMQRATEDAQRLGIDPESDAWKEYIAKLQARRMDPDTLKPLVPLPPRMLQDGTFLSNNMPGGEPDVIG